ncbi:MAG: Type-1 restriction enzyme EcoKI specificity protein [Ignavibacteriaceae bacterium]|nr:Type-1 restriction enzyme EcoKI specificity protein [Ignavibacteriaceae bacterium]
MKVKHELPEGWIINKLRDICLTASGGTPSRKISSYYEGNIPWVKSGELNNGVITKTEEYISEEALKNSSAKIFPKGTLLIALYGATIGKLGFLGMDAATNQAVCGIYKSEVIDLQFLQYYFYHKRNELIKRSAGGAQPNISQEILKETELPLPPLPEQHRIVAKIEELFSSLDKGIESLKTAQEQLKVYRQAVLKWAFEGKLTGQNCDVNDVYDAHDSANQNHQNHGNHRNHRNHSSDNGELPEGWVCKALGDICETTSGGTPSRKVTEYYGGNIPWVKSGELTGGIIMKTEENITEKAIKKSSAKVFPAGTLLIALYGATIGKLAFLGIEAATNQAVCGIFQNSLLDQRYLYNFLDYQRNNLIKQAIGGAQPNISQTILRNLMIPFPSSTQAQLRIVSEIESRLSVCDKIEESIESALLQAEALRQSILKKAFEGKLVPQDPNDEQASELLKRITAERKNVDAFKNK